MTRVKGLAFVSLFALALSAQPVLSQDRSSNPPPPTNRGTNADAPPPNPQNNPTAKPPRQRADGGQQRHRRHSNGDPSQAHSSDGKGSGTKRQGPPPGPPPGNQPAQGSDGRN
jgi:hypothetical protein